MTIPPHPDQHDDQTRTKTPLSARTKAIIVGVVVVAVLMIVLHVTGVVPH